MTILNGQTLDPIEQAAYTAITDASVGAALATAATAIGVAEAAFRVAMGPAANGNMQAFGQMLNRISRSNGGLTLVTGA